jgi:hypothetical protein
MYIFPDSGMVGFTYRPPIQNGEVKCRALFLFGLSLALRTFKEGFHRPFICSVVSKGRKWDVKMGFGAVQSVQH